MFEISEQILKNVNNDNKAVTNSSIDSKYKLQLISKLDSSTNNNINNNDKEINTIINTTIKEDKLTAYFHKQ